MQTLSVLVSVTAILSSLSVIVAIYYASRQLDESRSVRALDTILALHAQFLSPEFNRVRRAIREASQPLEPASLFASDMGQDLRNLLNQMELLGVLVREGFVDFELVAAVFPFFARTWDSVEPYVEFRRSQVADYGEYAKNAERLAERFVARGVV